MTARIAGFDMGSVNYAMAIIAHTPAERRRKVIAAAKLALLPPPVPEYTRLITSRVLNLKADHVVGKYQHDGKHPVTVAGKIPYESDVSTSDLIARLGRHLAAITELFVAPLPDVWVEIPGGGMASSQSDSYINWQLATATIAIISGIDAALGLAGTRPGIVEHLFSSLQVAGMACDRRRRAWSAARTTTCTRQRASAP